jgi:alpha-1,2-mannosyltransferase
VAFTPLVVLLFGHTIAQIIGETIGWYLQKRTAPKRAILLAKVAEEEAELAKAIGREKKARVSDEWERVESYAVGNATNGDVAEKDWEGIVGFLHPFCNAGGGGERVLWAAVRATQQRWPKAACVIYTGDHDVTKEKMLERVEVRG